MSRLIDADELRKRMYHEAFETDTDRAKWDSGLWIRYKMFEDILEECKITDTNPVRHGHWIEPSDSMTISCICSECNWESHYYEDDVNGMPYCPNCGAKMDEVEECQN